MFDGIYDLIKLADDNGVCTSIGTNATLVTGKIAIKLKEAGLKKVVVSIDGTKEMHDSIRGIGSYEKAIKGLYYLKNVGLFSILFAIFFMLFDFKFPTMLFVFRYNL